MLDMATLTIDLRKIEENARTVVSALPGVDDRRRHEGHLRQPRGRPRDAGGGRLGAG